MLVACAAYSGLLTKHRLQFELTDKAPLRNQKNSYTPQPASDNQQDAHAVLQNFYDEENARIIINLLLTPSHIYKYK